MHLLLILGNVEEGRMNVVQCAKMKSAKMIQINTDSNMFSEPPQSDYNNSSFDIRRISGKKLRKSCSFKIRIDRAINISLFQGLSA